MANDDGKVVPERAKAAASRAYALAVAIGSVCLEIATTVEVAQDGADFTDRDDFEQVIEFDESHVEGLADVLPTLILLFSAHLRDMRLPEAA